MPRLGIADELRPDQRTAVAGHEAHRHVRIADLGILLCDDDVAQQGQRRAEPGGVAVEPADERLVEIELAEHDLLRLASGLLEQGRVVDCRLHPIDIAAGAERAAAAGEHHHIRLGIVPDFDKDAGELGVERGIDRIERVRPVQRGQELPVTCHRDRADLDPALPQEENVLGGVALIEEIGPSPVLAERALAGELLDRARGHVLQDRGGGHLLGHPRNGAVGHRHHVPQSTQCHLREPPSAGFLDA